MIQSWSFSERLRQAPVAVELHRCAIELWPEVKTLHSPAQAHFGERQEGRRESSVHSRRTARLQDPMPRSVHATTQALLTQLDYSPAGNSTPCAKGNSYP